MKNTGKFTQMKMAMSRGKCSPIDKKTQAASNKACSKAMNARPKGK